MGPRRWEAARQSLDDELIEALGFGQVLQAMGADVAQSVGPTELTCALGDEHLAAVSGGGDSCAAVYVDADVMVVRAQGFARV